MATLRRREMAQLPAAGTLRRREMVQLPAAGTLRRPEMAQLQVQVTLPGPEMAPLPAAGTLRRVAALVLATVPRLVSVEVRATLGLRALVRAATVGPQAAVWLTGPAASLQQALGRAAGLLVWAVSGLPLAAAGLLGWAWLGRWMGSQECRCKLFRRI
jgi:hypothetical protein